MRLAKVILLFLLGAESAIGAQGMSDISRGTVNIALANSNGIVLLTDSVQTVQTHSGPHFTEPVRKLFRIDDKTVCSIAGFASETGWIRREMNTEVSGIISDFQGQLSQRPVPQFDAKLQAVAFLVGLYIDLIANRREVLAAGVTKADVYKFELILAGYDADGIARLAKIVITSKETTGASGTKYWSHSATPEVAHIEKKLVSLPGGIQVFSRAILDEPQKFGDTKIVRKYIEAKKHDGGASLTRDEMVSLASYMVSQAAAGTPSVGGPDQVAVLANGGIVSFTQPQMPDSPRPLHFSVMTRLKIEGALMFVPTPDNHLLWIRSQFVGIKNPMLRLDGQFFYGCEIRDSIVEYGGSLTDFGPTNKVVNSMILPGIPVGPASEADMLKIMNGFNWSLEPPNTPAVQHPTVSPLPD